MSTSIELPAEALQHRRAFREYVLNRAVPWHRQHLTRLYALWDDWNVSHFGGRLAPPYILLNEPSNPRRFGDCYKVSGFGGISQIRLRPSLLAGTHPLVRPGADPEGLFLFVADVLLHEMVHQFHQEITGDAEDSYHGHGPAFRDVCNRIGPGLGVGTVRSCKRRGRDRDLPSCSQWPYGLRPEDYYLGAVNFARLDAEDGLADPSGVTSSGDQLMTENDRAIVRLTLKLPPGPAGDAALKRALKCLGRSFGLTCLRIEDLPREPAPSEPAVNGGPGR
jgi:hypothetical protein